MTTLEISNVYDGAVLAKNICNNDGAIMIPHNTTLTKSIIRRLQNWGITEVEIYNSSSQEKVVPATPSIYPHLNPIGTIEKKFEHAEHSFYMNQLFEAIKSYFIVKEEA